ncbi:uncharacterized protein LOC131239112 [Magnolia sinica]|uniref:uncharacterized protein LOC131239112 n=1 Tax=Magnolia sinica TaxID=86752 RepID=UPI00265A3390|nr:uncharacterized protein LOC131239112 [Magnolia sinica]
MAIGFKGEFSCWSKFVKAKYALDFRSVGGVGLASFASPTWKHICKLCPVVAICTHWLIGQGDCNFWNEDWSGLGPLNAWKLLPLFPSHQLAKVSDVIGPSGWSSLSQVTHLLPQAVLDHISDVGICTSAFADKCIWLGSTSGELTASLAWRSIRPCGDRKPWWKWV